MSISLLKRYKNEINVILNRTKKRIGQGSVQNVFYFSVVCPWNKREDYFSKRVYFGKDIEFRNLLKVVEDNGLVYIGVNIDKNIKNNFLDSSFGGTFNYLSSSNIERQSFCLFRDMLAKEILYIIDECGNSRNLNNYNKDFVLKDKQEYVKGGLFEVDSRGNILCVDVDFCSVYWYVDKFVENNYKNSVIKDSKYYKLFVKGLEAVYSDTELRLADKEFPKLSNRNFLPIVTVDFDRDVVSYLCKSSVCSDAGTEMYRKGLNREGIEHFLDSTVNIIPPVSTVSIVYKGKEIRLNGFENIYIKV